MCKRCKSCQQEKPCQQYRQRSISPDRLMSICAKCELAILNRHFATWIVFSADRHGVAYSDDHKERVIYSANRIRKFIHDEESPRRAAQRDAATERMRERNRVRKQAIEVEILRMEESRRMYHEKKMAKVKARYKEASEMPRKNTQFFQMLAGVSAITEYANRLNQTP